MKVIAMMLCISVMWLNLSCSKETDTVTDPIVGTWELIDGTYTSEYSSGETYIHQAEGWGCCYAENGDYFYKLDIDKADLEGKWERIDSDRVGVLSNDDNSYDVHEILVLSDNVLKRKIVRTRENGTNPFTFTKIETFKRNIKP